MFNPRLEEQLAAYYKLRVGGGPLQVTVTPANDDQLLAAMEEGRLQFAGLRGEDVVLTPLPFAAEEFFSGDDHFWQIKADEEVVGYFAINPFCRPYQRVVLMSLMLGNMVKVEEVFWLTQA